MKTGKKVMLLIGAVLVLAGMVGGGIFWSQRGVVAVQTGKVIHEDLSAIVTASGQIMPPPDKFATVNANSMGKVTALLVQEGDHVTKGQLLMRTEDIQQKAGVDGQVAGLNSAKADFSVNQAAVASAQASLKTAEANLTQARAKSKQAHDDFLRAQQSFKEQLIAQQTFDQDLSNYQVAEATVQSNEAQISQAKAQLQQAIFNRDMAKARVKQAQAQLLNARDAYNKTIYTSPLNGVITSLPVHLGENVVPGIQNQTGSVLFQVSDLSVITAQVDVDETDIINVKLNQPAEISIDAIPNKTFKGHVTQIGMNAIGQNTGMTTSNTTTASTQEAKDFQVEVTLDNPPPGLRPGMSATAKVTTATVPNALTVPIQALTFRERRELEMEKDSGKKALAAAPETAAEKKQDKEELQGVFVVRNGRAVFATVKTGIMGSMDVQILNGLKPGEEIVTGSYQILRTLKNNAKVKVNNSTSALGPPASSSS
jgi:HlyD family secretion protein